MESGHLDQPVEEFPGALLALLDEALDRPPADRTGWLANLPLSQPAAAAKVEAMLAAMAIRIDSPIAGRGITVLPYDYMPTPDDSSRPGDPAAAAVS